MAQLRAHNISVSLDGFMAGSDQSRDNPLGVGGERLHKWAFETRTARQMHGLDGGAEDLDGEFVARGNAGIGATIMGRNMYGPIRGPWGSDTWTGWWGEDPPYHHPVFVLTHQKHPSIPMQGGTTFHFVTDGIEAALERAVKTADGADVRIGGGASSIQQYLRARLIDDLHVVLVPVLLGGGERLFDSLDGDALGYECVELVSSPSVVHLRLSRAQAA